MKTFVERHAAQTKASDVKIHLPATGTCVSRMLRRQPIVWKKRSLEEVSRALSPQLVQGKVSGSLVRMTCDEDAES